MTACGGGGGTIHFDPVITLPTTLVSNDGRIVATIPAGALTAEVKLTLVDRSTADREVAGPAGRTLAMAMELTATAIPTPTPEPTPAASGTASLKSGSKGITASSASQTGGGTTEPQPIVLASPVAILFKLDAALPVTATIPIYKYSTSSERYEDAGIGSALSADGRELSFSISEFGRYAYYGLLPEEFPPPAPTGLRLLAASTQVRKLQWGASPDTSVAGYNLYRTQAGTDAFTKANAELLTTTVYIDELAAPGAYQYRLVTVNNAGLESAPGNVVDSPAIDFDLYFTFGEHLLKQPTGLALDPLGERLYVADPVRRSVWIFDLAGKRIGELQHYGSAWMHEPTGVALGADGSLYIADIGMHWVYILDAQHKLTGYFGGSGDGPGELRQPVAVLPVEDKVVVADAQRSDLQSFTPRGVYLAQVAPAGIEDGQFTSPGGLFISQDAKLMVADTGNARVQILGDKFKFDSTLILEVVDGGPLLNPTSAVDDFRKRIYVSDSGNQRVVVFDNKQLLFSFGADGSEIVEFSPDGGPTGMAIDPTTGYLYVCDPGNHRIAVFRT